MSGFRFKSAVATKHGHAYWALIALAGFMLLAPALSWAAGTSPGTPDPTLPFIGVMDRLQSQLTGPFAFAISIIGIVVAGAMLIFGGDMNGFIRTLVFLVLVVAVISGASNIMQFINGAGAVIASFETMPAIDQALRTVRA